MVSYSLSEAPSHQLGIDKYIVDINVAQQAAISVCFGHIALQTNLLALDELTVCLPCLQSICFQRGAYFGGINADIPDAVIPLNDDGIAIDNLDYGGSLRR